MSFSLIKLQPIISYIPPVTGLTNGNVFVAWEDFRSATLISMEGSSSPNGTALGSDFLINQNTTNDQYVPSVAGLINGNVFVAWHDDRA